MPEDIKTEVTACQLESSHLSLSRLSGCLRRRFMVASNSMDSRATGAHDPTPQISILRLVARQEPRLAPRIVLLSKACREG